MSIGLFWVSLLVRRVAIRLKVLTFALFFCNEVIDWKNEPFFFFNLEENERIIGSETIKLERETVICTEQNETRRQRRTNELIQVDLDEDGWSRKPSANDLSISKPRLTFLKFLL